MVQLSTQPPLRADARRNREAILEAARAEFGERGGDASMDGIALRAGVAVGTIYRHFPTKDELLGGLVRERFLGFAEQAREPRRPGESAFGQLTRLIHDGCERLEHDAGTRFALTDRACRIEAGAEKSVLNDRYRPIIADAQAEGELRGDFVVEEIGMLMCGICAWMQQSDGVGGHPSWQRYFTIVVDGLRARD